MDTWCLASLVITLVDCASISATFALVHHLKIDIDSPGQLVQLFGSHALTQTNISCCCNAGPLIAGSEPASSQYKRQDRACFSLLFIICHVNHYHAGLFHGNISAEVSTYCNTRCTLQWISQQPMVIEQALNFLNIILWADEPVCYIRLCLHWNKLFYTFWRLKSPIVW